MKQFLYNLMIFIKKAYNAVRYRHILLGISLIILMVGVTHLWKHKPTYQEPPTFNSEMAHASGSKVPLLENAGSTQEDEPVNEEDNDEEAAYDDSDDDGSSVWSVLESVVPSRYSNPTSNTKSPSVIIIVTGLGLNVNWTNHILSTIDKNITLTFSPYCTNVIEQIQKASSLGYHSLVSLPMEPFNFPTVDPGFYTLLTGAKEGENLRKVKLLLDKLPKGTCIIGEYGTKFSLSKSDLEPILNEIKIRGSMFVDPNTTLHSQIQKTCKTLNMTCPQVNMALSMTANPIEQDEFVKKLIQNAKENGIIMVSVPAIPAFVSEMPKWVETIRKNNVTLLSISGLQTNSVAPESNNQGIVNAQQ